MSCVIDLASRRQTPSPKQFLSHPTGVTLPFDERSHSDLIIPEVRNAISAGSYGADAISHLPDLVQDGDRALVIGAGLGVVSTLIAQRTRVERVIAVEADVALIPYLDRVHALNGVPWVETVNAVLGVGRKGRVSFFGGRDVRTSSLRPEGHSVRRVMRVPCMDLNLILAEERISLIVCDVSDAMGQLLTRANLGSVARIMISTGGNPSACPSSRSAADNGVCALLAARGFTVEVRGRALLFDRATAKRKVMCPTEVCA